MLDEILTKLGLKYEDLDSNERQTLNSWLGALQQNQVTTEKIKEYVQSMKFSVEQELSTHDIGSKQDIFLKARLRNYMLLEAFLTTPEKAKAALERTVTSMIPSK